MPNLLWAIIIGLVAGWLAGYVMRGSGFGVLGNIVVGVIGAALGSLIFGWLGIGAGGLIGEIIVATIGAIVLLFIVGLVQGRRGTSAPV